MSLWDIGRMHTQVAQGLAARGATAAFQGRKPRVQRLSVLHAPRASVRRDVFPPFWASKKGLGRAGVKTFGVECVEDLSQA